MRTSGCLERTCRRYSGTVPETTGSRPYPHSCAWLLAGLLIAGLALLFAAPSPAWAEDPPAEVCDGIDNDGDGDVDEDLDDCLLTSVLVDPPPEVCDGVDNDGDGDVDEGFDVGADCTLLTTNAFGTCATQGTKVCTADTTGTECVLCELGTSGLDCVPDDDVPLDEAEPEVLAANDLSCFDGVDNDCDATIDVGGGLIDGAPVGPDAGCVTPVELFCNGLDDDNDGVPDDEFGVGQACTEGIGECERSGSIVCDASDPTQQSTECSASPGTDSPENTPGEGVCVDDKDNDCDGLTDLADEDCQTAELCDGADNDGDGVADEDFSDLGEACTVGVGTCEVDGIRACNASGDATQCNVVAGLPGIEGPAGATCSDEIDNDCDGLADGDDPSCSSADIAVSCSLVSLKYIKPKAPKVGTRLLGPFGPPRRNPPGTSCEEKFRLEIESNVDAQFLTAEVMGLNPDGSLIDLSPSTLPVQDGDELHLNSRLDPEDWKVDAKGRFIDVFAPVPLVRVTADTGQNRVEAFCSHIPWLNVDKPAGADQVVSGTEADLVEVLVPIPRVDPATLGIVVDGVDILDDTHLDVDPAIAFPNPGAPISGTIDINGQLVTVGDLVVDTASDLHVLGVNSLTMTLENLGGGGHIVVVNGDPREEALPRRVSDACHVDDVLDAGTVAVFGITIVEPEADSEVPAGDTTVSARIDHGRDIASAEVQGVAASLLPQTCSALTFEAFGEIFSVDSCTRDILEVLPQTDLSMPLLLGTIDIGQNILTIGARDDLLNQVFARQRFTSGIGSTSSPGTLTLAPQTRARIESKLWDAFEDSPEFRRPIEIQVTEDALNFNLAFTFGASEAGINSFFGSVCTDALVEVQRAIDDALLKTPLPSETIEVNNACDPTVRLTGLDFQFVPPSLTCEIDAVTDLVTVTVALPHIDFFVGVQGRCKSTFLGVCISEVVVDLNLDVDIDNFGVDFDIDESLALAGGQTPADIITGTIMVNAPGSGVEINCIAGFINDVLSFFTFGLVNFEAAANNAVQDALDFEDVDLAEALRAETETSPFEIDKIELNENPVNADGLEVQQEILSVQITGQPGLDDGTGNDGIKDGLTGTIGANFTVPLPEQEGFAGTVIEPPPSPDYPLNAKDIFFAPSDDIFNLLFAAIGLQGGFITSCVDSGLTLEDTLPADCTTLVGSDQVQTDIMIGRCHGAKGIDCTTLTNPGQWFFCEDTQNQLAAANVSKDTGLHFCANQPIAPRTLIKDFVPTPDVVEAEIHANDLQVTLALDRSGDGQIDPTLLEPLAFGFAPFCDANGDVTQDCRWSAACLDLNLDAEFALGTSTTGSAEIVRTVTGVDPNFVGMDCSGLLSFGGIALLLNDAGTSGPVVTIGNNIQDIVQVFEGVGLDLGGLVGIQNPTLIAIDVPGYSDDDCADCAEYVGVTGDISP